MGVLRSKMSELTSEVTNMRSQISSATEEQSTFLAYDKRVKETASELTNLQSQLADYNLLVDKMNTGKLFLNLEPKLLKFSAPSD